MGTSTGWTVHILVELHSWTYSGKMNTQRNSGQTYISSLPLLKNGKFHPDQAWAWLPLVFQSLVTRLAKKTGNWTGHNWLQGCGCPCFCTSAKTGGHNQSFGGPVALGTREHFLFLSYILSTYNNSTWIVIGHSIEGGGEGDAPSCVWGWGEDDTLSSLSLPVECCGVGGRGWHIVIGLTMNEGDMSVEEEGDTPSLSLWSSGHCCHVWGGKGRGEGEEEGHQHQGRHSCCCIGASSSSLRERGHAVPIVVVLMCHWWSLRRKGEGVGIDIVALLQLLPLSHCRWQSLPG